MNNNRTLTQLYQEHQGKVSDKWSLYLNVYDRLFSEFREREIRLLEIGIQNGGSLEIWASYFPCALKLIGCDIDLNCQRLGYADQRIAVVIGDANLDGTESLIASYAETYDIIIDDGSHRSSDIVKSFARYFPRLVDGGIFVAEDLHCSYWQEFEGGLFDPYSSITFFKRLADIVNHEHWGVEKKRQELLAGFCIEYGVLFDEDVLSHIHSIEFLNSICIIRKFPPVQNVSGLRRIVGTIELVQSDVKIYNNSEANAIDQSNNIWSARRCPPDEELLQRLKDIEVRDVEIIELTRKGIEKDNEITSLSQNLDYKDNQIVRKDQAEIAKNEEIKSLKRTVSEKDANITALSGQRAMLNTELIKLNAERATFGASVGRGVTKLRGQVAPVGSKRGTFVRIFTKLATTLHKFGLKATVVKCYRSASFRLASMAGRFRAPMEAGGGGGAEVPNGGHVSAATVQAVHPQLSQWFEKNEPSAQQLIAQKDKALLFHYKPLLSVILPVYKVPKDVLDETLASLEHQTYKEWQACIVWSDIDDVLGWEWLQSRCEGDSRFKLRLLSENGGISRNSNSALELVDGEYIALLDHDDTITPWAFFEIVNLLQTQPELDFIYSDKDSITADGSIRLNALFKPAWSPEMLHSVNYLTHLNVMRTSLVHEIGGWREQTDGAQDWDLFFRITERTKNIARVSSILYHWRVLPTSTATGLAAKPYAALGQLRSQQDYFMRRGLAGAVVPSPEGMFKVEWPIHAELTDVVIFQTGTLDQLIDAIAALQSGSHESIRKLHVIHSSPACAALTKCQNMWSKPTIFTEVDAANWRVALETTILNEGAETICILDGRVLSISDTLVDELSGWVAQHPDIAWASAIALNMDGVVCETGRVVSPDYQSAPLFGGASLYSYGWFGGPLWYRNTRACSPYAVALKACDIPAALLKSKHDFGNPNEFVSMCFALLANGDRGLIDPFARVYFKSPPEISWPNDGHLFHSDPYFSPVFDQVSPLRLAA